MLTLFKRRLGGVVRRVVQHELRTGAYPDHGTVQSVLDAYEMRLDALEAEVMPCIERLHERIERLERGAKSEA